MLFLRKLTSYGFFKEFAFYLIFFFKREIAIRKLLLLLRASNPSLSNTEHRKRSRIHRYCAKVLEMSTLDATRAELALVVLYLNKAEARDKICRAIQYGSKFLSNGEPGTAQNVDRSTALARKVFRLFKFVNDLHGLISPTAQGTPLPLVLLGKSKNALLSTFLFLDQIVWLSRTGIYKNKERAELIGRISLFCWMGSSICSTLVELGELGRLSSARKKLEKDLKNRNKYEDEKYRAKVQQSNERSLALIKAAMDVVVAIGLLQLAPKKVTPRVTGAFGFVTSLISCYQLLPSAPKPKAS
ncbi:unnamed protein product [Citrullus colocynthis]|uniref:Uncharacterized protein n=1 Tax=Citrullus colocynthis TaxID=252529 RepID=A0ABP0YHK9_9ROSI